MSPTYSIVNETNEFVHADLYRLEEPNELIHLELNLYLEDKEYFLVEWGEEYIDYLYKEINEDIHFYLLKININNTCNNDQTPSRDFLLHKVKFS